MPDDGPAAKLLAADSTDTGHVFTSRTGAPLGSRTVARSFKAALERAGLDGWLTFHALRHTHASQLIAAGWTVPDVAARLGDSIATSQTTYVHEFDAARREDEQRAGLAVLAADGSAMAARGGTVRNIRSLAAVAGTPS